MVPYEIHFFIFFFLSIQLKVDGRIGNPINRPTGSRFPSKIGLGTGAYTVCNGVKFRHKMIIPNAADFKWSLRGRVCYAPDLSGCPRTGSGANATAATTVTTTAVAYVSATMGYGRGQESADLAGPTASTAIRTARDYWRLPGAAMCGRSRGCRRSAPRKTRDCHSATTTVFGGSGRDGTATARSAPAA